MTYFQLKKPLGWAGNCALGNSSRGVEQPTSGCVATWRPEAPRRFRGRKEERTILGVRSGHHCTRHLSASFSCHVRLLETPQQLCTCRGLPDAAGYCLTPGTSWAFLAPSPLPHLPPHMWVCSLKRQYPASRPLPWQCPFLYSPQTGFCLIFSDLPVSGVRGPFLSPTFKNNIPAITTVSVFINYHCSLQIT